MFLYRRRKHTDLACPCGKSLKQERSSFFALAKNKETVAPATGGDTVSQRGKIKTDCRPKKYKNFLLFSVPVGALSVRGSGRGHQIKRYPPPPPNPTLKGGCSKNAPRPPSCLGGRILMQSVRVFLWVASGRGRRGKEMFPLLPTLLRTIFKSLNCFANAACMHGQLPLCKYYGAHARKKNACHFTNEKRFWVLES